MTNFTIVTAFFDIGRGNWNYYQRKQNEYLSHFSNMLSLKDVNIIVFTEERYHNFVSKENDKAFIVLKNFKDLYTFKKYSDIIISNLSEDKYRENHPNPVCPEVTQPYYNILVTNKMKFLEEAMILNPFSSEYFFWMDAGYTHSTISLKDIIWDIFPLFTNKFSIIMIDDLNKALISPKDFFYQYIDVITGGFFGGRKDMIATISLLYYTIVDSIIDTYNITDDDQYYMTMLILRYPELFTLYSGGGWYGGITLFRRS